MRGGVVRGGVVRGGVVRGGVRGGMCYLVCVRLTPNTCTHVHSLCVCVCE